MVTAALLGALAVRAGECRAEDAAAYP